MSPSSSARFASSAARFASSSARVQLPRSLVVELVCRLGELGLAPGLHAVLRCEQFEARGRVGVLVESGGAGCELRAQLGLSRAQLGLSRAQLGFLSAKRGNFSLELGDLSLGLIALTDRLLVAGVGGVRLGLGLLHTLACPHDRGVLLRRRRRHHRHERGRNGCDGRGQRQERPGRATAGMRARACVVGVSAGHPLPPGGHGEKQQ